VARRLAHEIKNPLTPIKLSAERLQRRFASQVDRKDIFDECTHTVIAQVERLQRLISDFSSLARMPQPRLATCSINKLLEEMAQLFRPYAQVEVRMAEEALVCDCDVDQMKQVLINLVDNAIAASREGEPVTLSAVQEQGWLCFHVTNEGDGIDPEVATHLFEPYFSTKDGGSGLGLAIAKRIAEDHDGELWLASLASPTDFCLKVPIQSPRMEKL